MSENQTPADGVDTPRDTAVIRDSGCEIELGEGLKKAAVEDIGAKNFESPKHFGVRGAWKLKPKSVIALDFDGTCVYPDYPGVGREIGAAPVLHDLVAAGHYLVLWTVRSGAMGDPNADALLPALAWFQKHRIPLHSVNCLPGQKDYSISPKVDAHLYIDNKGLGIPLVEDDEKPFVDWDRVREYLITEGYLPEPTAPLHAP